MLSLHTNSASMTAQSALATSYDNLMQSQERLATGYRINSASDDAAGLQIATRLESQASGMEVAMRNTQDAKSMLQTAEGALDEVTNNLMRMKDLALQASNGTNSVEDLNAIQAEYDALGAEISNIMTNTTYAGDKLFAANSQTSGGGVELGGKMGSTGGVTFQIGATAEETMTVDISAELTTMNTALTAVSDSYAGVSSGPGDEFVTGSGSNMAVSTSGDFSSVINGLDSAISAVGQVQSAIGASMNRLDSTYNNLSNMHSNTTEAYGNIMDTDYAEEVTNSTNAQMLMQAGIAVLKQSNQTAGMINSLLQ